MKPTYLLLLVPFLLVANGIPYRSSRVRREVLGGHNPHPILNQPQEETAR